MSVVFYSVLSYLNIWRGKNYNSQGLVSAQIIDHELRFDLVANINHPHPPPPQVLQNYPLWFNLMIFPANIFPFAADHKMGMAIFHIPPKQTTESSTTGFIYFVLSKRTCLGRLCKLQAG